MQQKDKATIKQTDLLNVVKALMRLTNLQKGVYNLFLYV